MKYTYMYDVSVFGKRLSTIRRQHNMTQEKLAELLCLSVDSISKIENGKINCMPEHFTKICQIFNVSADYFLFGMDRELIPKNAVAIDEIINCLYGCTEVQISKINRLIQIMLELPVA